MKMTKNDYEITTEYLARNLKPILKKISSKKNTKEEIQLLRQALDIFFDYAMTIKILSSQKSKAGRKTYKENEKVIHIAYEDCIKSLNGIYPTYQEFKAHWNNPKKYKLPEEDKASNIIKIKKDGVKLKTELINGLGEDRLEKFCKTFKNKEKRISKLIELGILDKMAETKTRLSDMINIKSW